MKSVQRNRFLFCFQPVAMEVEDEPNRDNCANDGRLITYISVRNANNCKVQSIQCFLSDKETSRSNLTKTSSGRSFSRILKAVLYKTSSSKRCRDRKDPEKKSAFRKSARTDLGDNSIGRSASSLSSRSMTSCSSFTSSSTSSTSIASIVESKKNDTDFWGERQKPKDVKRRTTGVNVNSLLFLFFFSLAATIFWGRLFAVLFTSIWLYLNPHRSAVDTRPEYVIKLPETDSRAYYSKNKKKVIMEGLLERNHHRGHLSLT